jgi:putative MFS transporter
MDDEVVIDGDASRVLDTDELPGPLLIREHVDVVGWSRVTTVMFVCCGLYWLADAIELGLMSYLVPQLTEAWTLDQIVSDSIAAIVFSGIVVGSLLFGLVSDRFGRKMVFLVTATGTGVFGVASAFSPHGSLACILVLRFCCGVFLGGGPAAYGYFIEFVPLDKQWVMVYFNLWFTFGSVLEAILAFVVLPSTLLGPDNAWRYLVAFSSAPILVLVFAFPFIKESPQWLISAGRLDDANNLIDFMYETNHKTRTADVIHAVEKGRGRIWTLFERAYIRRTILFALIWFCVSKL